MVRTGDDEARERKTIRNSVLSLESDATNERQPERKAQEALEQITSKHYDEFFGIDVPPEVIHYGIAFYKKKCHVKMERVQGA